MREDSSREWQDRQYRPLRTPLLLPEHALRWGDRTSSTHDRCRARHHRCARRVWAAARARTGRGARVGDPIPVYPWL